MDYKDMTNAELSNLAKELNVEVEAKNPGKPNKGELLAALDAFKNKQDIANGVEVDESEGTIPEDTDTEDTPPTVTPEPEGPKPIKATKKPSTKAALMRADLFRKERVIVNDNQANQTKDEMISVSWGNRKIGAQTDFVSLTGEEQYIRRGALANLREATYVKHEPKPNGGDQMVITKRFVIADVEGMTQKELDELGNKQAMRNAKYA